MNNLMYTRKERKYIYSAYNRENFPDRVRNQGIKLNAKK